jgi:hypothetical protein
MSLKHLPIASYISKRPSMTRSCRNTRKALFGSPAEKRRRKLQRQRNERRKRVLPRHMLISLTRLKGKVWTSGRLVQDLFVHRTAQKCLINHRSKVLRNLRRAPGQFDLMKMKYVNRFIQHLLVLIFLPSLQHLVMYRSRKANEPWIHFSKRSRGS